MTDDERAIRALIVTWLAASAAGDIDTVLDLMADDVLFMVPGREPFGKEEFASSARAMTGVRMEGTSDVREVLVAGEWAWIRTHLRVTITPPNGSEVRRSGYTLSIARKEPTGKWVLARDANLLTVESPKDGA